MTIVKRGTKGSALTYNEMDENIRDLYEDTTINRVLENASGSGSDIQHLTYSAPSNGALNDHDDPGFITVNYNTRIKFPQVDEDDESFCCADMLDMKNHNIVGVNHLKFSDPGPSEGLQWSNIKMFESPDDLTTNSAGNLQVIYDGNRKLTVNADGIDVVGTIKNEQFTIPNSAGTAGQVLKWPASGTALEWANDNSGGGGSYRKGEVIEYLTGLGDGRTLDAEADASGNSRDITMDTANQTSFGQTVSSHSFSGYQTVSGTEFDYYPPAGTKTVEITYEIYVGSLFSISGGSSPSSWEDGLLHFKPKVDGTYLTNRPSNYFGAHGHKQGLFSTTIVLSVDGSGNTAAGNINNWTSAKTIKLDVAEYANTGAFRLHLVSNMDGGGNGGNSKTGNVMPTVRIVATA
jgi:hypothetical protein